MKTLWIIEATCPRCGESYNPESIEAEDVQHWCDDEQFGGKPKEVWMIYLEDERLTREKRVLKTRLVGWKANLAAVGLTGVLIVILVWNFMNAIKV